MYYSYKELDLEEDNTPYDDGLADAYVAEQYESSDSTSTEVEGFSDDALFEPLRELED